jgi:hypothetical protein
LIQSSVLSGSNVLGISARSISGSPIHQTRFIFLADLILEQPDTVNFILSLNQDSDFNLSIDQIRTLTLYIERAKAFSLER